MSLQGKRQPEHRFSQATNDFASLLAELSAEWPPERILPLAKQYLTNVEDLISHAERHGGRLDFGRASAEEFYRHSLEETGAGLDADDPTFFEDAFEVRGTVLDDERSMAFEDSISKLSNDVVRPEQSFLTVEDDHFSPSTSLSVSSALTLDPRPPPLGDSGVSQTVDPRSVQHQQSRAWQATSGQEIRGSLASRKHQTPAPVRAEKRVCRGLSHPGEQLSMASGSHLARSVPKTKPSQLALVTSLFKYISEQAVQQNYERAPIAPEEIRNVSLSTNTSIHHIKDVLEALKQADAMVRHSVFVRRMFLVRLATIRTNIEAEVELDRGKNRKTPQSSVQGVVGAEVLDRMTLAAYPCTAEDVNSLERRSWRIRYEKERKSIKNRLCMARNWYEAANRFGDGIIALFPEGDSSYETLKIKDCETLLDWLEQKFKRAIQIPLEQLTPPVTDCQSNRDP